MAVAQEFLKFSGEANADLSAKQFFIVKLVAGPKIALAGAGERGVGILMNKPKSGESADVAMFGRYEFSAGGSVSVGDHVKADANGQGVTTTTDKDKYIGICLKAPTAASEIGEILLGVGLERSV